MTALRVIIVIDYKEVLYLVAHFRAADAIQLLTDVEGEYETAYMFLAEAANQVFRFLQKVTGNTDYLYWTYGLLQAWDTSIGMLALDE